MKAHDEDPQIEPTENLRYSHAKHDPATCMAAGLFQPILRGKRPKGVTHIAQYTNLRLEFRCFWQLGAEDLRVLQGLLALASPLDAPEILTADSMLTDNRELREKLKLSKSAAKVESLVVRGSYYLLAKEIGLKTRGNTFRHLRESIDRLSLVNVRVILAGQDEKTYSSNLLSYSIDEKHLEVALNPRLTAAVLGERIAANGSHTRIDLTEVRAIDGDITRILHQYLCALINLGETRTLQATTMMNQIWTGDASVKAKAKQRNRLHKALEDLRQIGWKSKSIAGNRAVVGKSHYLKYEITRPKSKTVDIPAETAGESMSVPADLPLDLDDAPVTPANGELEGIIKKSPGIALRDHADQLTLGQFLACVTQQPIAAMRHCLDRLSDEQLEACLAKNPAAALRYASRRLSVQQITKAAADAPDSAVRYALPEMDREQQKNLVVQLSEKIMPFHLEFPDRLLDEVAAEVPFDALRFAKDELSPEKIIECMENSPVGAIRYCFGDMTAGSQSYYLQAAPWAMLALRREYLTDEEIDAHAESLIGMTHRDFQHRKLECPEIIPLVKLNLQKTDYRYCDRRGKELRLQTEDFGFSGRI